MNAGLEREYQAAVERAGWAEIPVAVLRVTGRDRVRWLHKLITADVEHLAVGQGTRAALLDAKGHFVADFILLVEDEAVLLVVERAAKEPLLDNLRRYIIREKVLLADESEAWNLFTLIGPESDPRSEVFFGTRAPDAPYHFDRIAWNGEALDLIRGARARVPATDVLAPAAVGAAVLSALQSLPQLSDAIVDALRVEAGLPRWGIDFDSGTLALEIPGVLSIRVDQGCYVGQEVVARLVHRGHVNRRLVGLKFDSTAPPLRGATIVHDGRAAGSITSAAESPRFGAIGLGYIRREAAEAGTIVQVGEEVKAQVVNLPFEE